MYLPVFFADSPRSCLSHRLFNWSVKKVPAWNFQIIVSLKTMINSDLRSLCSLYANLRVVRFTRVRGTTPADGT